MVFYRDVYENKEKKATWINGHYIGETHGTRIMDSFEFKKESS